MLYATHNVHVHFTSEKSSVEFLQISHCKNFVIELGPMHIFHGHLSCHYCGYFAAEVIPETQITS